MFLFPSLAIADGSHEKRREESRGSEESCRSSRAKSRSNGPPKSCSDSREGSREGSREEAAREAAREAAQAAKAAKKASNKETSSLTTAEREELAATRESLAMVLKSLEALTSQRASRELHQVVLTDSPVVSQKPKGRNTRNSQKAKSSSQLQRLDSIMIKSYFSNFRQQRCPPGGNGHC